MYDYASSLCEPAQQQYWATFNCDFLLALATADETISLESPGLEKLYVLSGSCNQPESEMTAKYY